uniref:Voltage-dependent calcium channel alpha-2/delta subunit conserved region domain-containing protein n=1 Tax=Oryzias sinensis TaxID=183150 RepID=A0A8C7WX35_9TELE
ADSRRLVHFGALFLNWRSELYRQVRFFLCLFQIGRFFGAIDGSIMASLIKMGMFKKVSLFDYQAMCRNSHHHSSSARPLFTVSLQH